MSKRLGGGKDCTRSLNGFFFVLATIVPTHSKSPNFYEAVVSRRCRMSEGFHEFVRVCPGINVRFLCTTNTHSSRWVHKYLVNNISI